MGSSGLSQINATRREQAVSATEVPLDSITRPDTVRTAAGHEQGVALSRDGYVGGARLLVSDVRVAILLLDEARYRVVARLFGVPRDKSLLVTIVALGTVAGAAHGKAAQVLRVPAGPSVADTVMGAAVVRESVHRIAGAWSRDSPFFGTLVAVAVLGASFRPVLGASFRGVKASSHRARAGFDHRYGHLVRASRRRR